MLQTVLTLSVIVSAAFHIWSEYRNQQIAIYISKPLTTILILVLACLGQSSDPLYKYMIVAGVLFSLAGDVFLMLPSDRFVEGLAAFLVAHLFYIAAFVPTSGSLKWWPLIPLVMFGIAVYAILASYLDDKKLPVLLYLLVILVMVWFSWERWGQTGQTGALLAFGGAILFVISDTILGVEHFRIKFKTARALNLSTYFAAQWCIATSVGGWYT